MTSTQANASLLRQRDSRHPDQNGVGDDKLKALGVTHVELLPVMAFDEQDIPASAAALGLRNYWGYSTHSFYSPHPRYCVEPARAPQEFRAFVDALHAAGFACCSMSYSTTRRRPARTVP